MANRSKSLFNTLLAILFLFVLIDVDAKGASAQNGRPKSQVEKANADLISAANEYKASVQNLIPMYEKSLAQATEALELRKELFGKGIVSKRDLETGEQAVKEARAKLDEARKQLVDSDHLIAEVMAERDTAKHRSPLTARTGKYTSSPAILRSSGAAGWTLAQAASVQRFFQSSFGRTLPVSAYGQTATHDRMRFNHRNSMDVAVHPDSAEGRALIAYLRSNGIPFIAFRSAVPGAATGAHVHIGYPSHKF
jgi:hypothetical protein